MMKIMFALMAFGLMSQVACNNSKAVPDPPKPSGGEQGTSKAPPPQSGIPDDIYPELPVQLLNPKERATLVEVTKAQLCPCPKASDSMHACLQKRETQCALANNAALFTMGRIKEGYGERDVLDSLGTYIEAAYKTYEFDLSGTPHQGDPSAPIVIVEFADFECPFCNIARGMMKEVRKVHGDKVVFYFKQFPLSSHVHAASAARAALAAHKQGKFWPMYDLIFDNQRALNDQKIQEIAQTVGLNMDQFLKDWRDPALAERVEKEKKEGIDSSVDATPSFFINGRKYLGDKTPAGLVTAVAEALNKK